MAQRAAETATAATGGGGVFGVKPDTRRGARRIGPSAAGGGVLRLIKRVALLAAASVVLRAVVREGSASTGNSAAEASAASENLESAHTHTWTRHAAF